MDSKLSMQNEYMRCWIEDGLVFMDYNSDLVVDLHVVKTCVEDRMALSRAVPYDMPLIANYKNTVRATKEAKKYLSGQKAREGLTAGAFLIESAPTRFLINFFLLVNRPPIPAKTFFEYDQAIKWAHKHRSPQYYEQA